VGIAHPRFVIFYHLFSFWDEYSIIKEECLLDLQQKAENEEKGDSDGTIRGASGGVRTL
jgi:hypothetical protein